jgi:hypothetical protein
LEATSYGVVLDTEERLWSLVGRRRPTAKD